MADPTVETNQPKVLKFLNDYRKTLSLLKIKSFYANHLCKKNCLEGRLNANNDICLKECDSWLDSYFDKKEKLNPDPSEEILISSSQIPEKDRAQYETDLAKFRLSINEYLGSLGSFIDDKISQQTRQKAK